MTFAHDQKHAANDAEASAQLSPLQPMETLTNLIGGIAHDFNNLLAVLSGSLELLEPEILTKTGQAHLERALKAAEAGARLTSRLLTFAQRRRTKPIFLDLNGFISAQDKSVRAKLDSAVTLHTALTSKPCLIRADPLEIENALIELLLNACEAMPDGGGIRLETTTVDIGPQARRNEAAFLAKLLPGTYARLSVIDTGAGIPPEILPRVFEPFFTTKTRGNGSGLGLSAVYGFAKQLGGGIEIASARGSGTAVHVYFPCAEDETAD